MPPVTSFGGAVAEFAVLRSMVVGSGTFSSQAGSPTSKVNSSAPDTRLAVSMGGALVQPGPKFTLERRPRRHPRLERPRSPQAEAAPMPHALTALGPRPPNSPRREEEPELPSGWAASMYVA